MKGEGASFVWVKDRGEMKLRCKACGKVVAVKDWFKHKCMDITHDAAPERLCGECNLPLHDGHQWCPRCSSVVGEGSETR
jgi:uncharacterized C2H2 Zn-finger protein